MARNPFATWKFWFSSSIVASVLLIRYGPQYSVGGSYTKTASLIFLGECLTYIAYTMFLYPHFLSPLRHLPTVTKDHVFLAGQFPVLMKESSGLPMRRWSEEIPNNGLIRYFHLFNRERLLVTSPKGLAEVLNTKSYEFIKPVLLRRGVAKILGMGILFAEGDEHKVQRKNLMPAFNFRHVKELYPVFWDKSREMVTTIEKGFQADEPVHQIEAGEWSSRATLDIIGLAGMGQNFNSLADPDTELNQVYRRIFSPNQSARILQFLQFFLPAFIIQNIPVSHNDNIAAASKVARDTSRKLVREKKAKLEKQEKGTPDIISIALESGGFTEDQLVDNMMTFLAAGHETTASAFTWAVYLMCQNPEVQDRLREEVHAHIPHLSNEIDNTIIDNMPYLHAVCQEVLRFYSPVPLTIRDTAVNTSILGTPVPRGTTIILAPWAINHSKEYWGEDADKFNPDRWMGAGKANSGGASSNYAFLTFLHGPRSCIGSKFATAELACLLAAFVGRFEFKQTYPDEVISIKGGITARPRHGMRLDVNVVESW